MVDYSLTRSRRKTLCIRIRDGAVFVGAPLHMSSAEIERFVASKERWIAEKLAVSREQMAKRGAFHLDYGGRLLYRGWECPIRAAESGPGYDGSAFLVPPGLGGEGIKAACIQIYRSQAALLFPEKVRLYSQVMGAYPTSVRVINAKTRWGCCSPQGKLNFSWRLMMAADATIDYVVVHELAHLFEMNHSKRFWAVVGHFMPDYRERIGHLRALQKRLACENW